MHCSGKRHDRGKSTICCCSSTCFVISIHVPDNLRGVLGDGQEDAIASIFEKYGHRLAMPLGIIVFVVNASICACVSSGP